MTAPSQGVRVRWNATGERGQALVVSGIVQGQGPHGRIEVRDDEGGIHHVQPSWVQIEES